MNIPIYRAKKIDSDEYVEGYYYKDGNNHIIFNGDSRTIFGLRVIDSTTLSIHFPDMLDSQRNKIFASLSEDGKGSSLISFSFGIPNKQVKAPVVYKDSRIIVITQGYTPSTCELCDLKTFVGEYEVIGIQE